MRIKRITHITSFSTTGEMYEEIKRVAHQLKITSSDLIRMSIEYFLKKRSLGESSKTNEGDGNELL